MTTNAPDIVDKALPDVVPPLGDDIATSTPERLPDPSPQPSEPDKAEAPKVETQDDVRQRIAERFRQNRDKLEGEPGTIEDTHGLTVPPFLSRQSEEDGKTADPAPASADQAPETPARPTETERVALKVRGRDITMTRDELVRQAGFEQDEAGDIPLSQLIKLAQKHIAADSYLEESRQMHKDTRQSGRTVEPKDDGKPEPKPPEKTVTQVDPDFRDLVEKIQFADPDEAARALQDTIEKRVDTKIEQSAAQRTSRAENQQITSAIESFVQDNADIYDDQLAGRVVPIAVMDEIIKDFERLGIPRDKLEETITDVDLARSAYAAARAEGLKVRDPRAILDAAGTQVRTRFNIQKPSAPASNPASNPNGQVQSRVDMKRMLPSQPPRTAAPQPSATQQEPSPNRMDPRVASMRRARGQTV